MPSQTKYIPPDIKETLVRLLGPLSENTHSYYSEISGEVLWTERKKTPAGLEYQLTVDICPADEGGPAAVIFDFWWFPPAMKGTMIGKVIDCWSVCYNLEEVEALLLHLESETIPSIEWEHQRMLERAASRS